MQVEKHREYRVTINIRRKGEGYMEGLEIKTEHCSSVEEILDKSSSFIADTIYEDLEGNDE